MKLDGIERYSWGETKPTIDNVWEPRLVVELYTYGPKTSSLWFFSGQFHGVISLVIIPSRADFTGLIHLIPGISGHKCRGLSQPEGRLQAPRNLEEKRSGLGGLLKPRKS